MLVAAWHIGRNDSAPGVVVDIWQWCWVVAVVGEEEARLGHRIPERQRGQFVACSFAILLQCSHWDWCWHCWPELLRPRRVDSAERQLDEERPGTDRTRAMVHTLGAATAAADGLP